MIMPLWAPGPQYDVERSGRPPRTQQCPEDKGGGLSEATTHVPSSSPWLHKEKFFTDPLYKSGKGERWLDKGHCEHLLGYG